MPIDPLKLTEFFTEIINSIKESSTVPHFCEPQESDVSFFTDSFSHSVECISLEHILKNQCNFLQALANQWQQTKPLPWQFLHKVDEFILENIQDLNTPKMEVRKILDFVYAVV